MSLIVNGDFQTGSIFPGWIGTTSGGGFYDVIPSGRPVGPGPPYYCVDFSVIFGVDTASIRQSFNTAFLTEYVVSFWVKPRPTNVLNSTALIRVYNPDFSTIYYTLNYVIPPGTDWQNVVFTFTTDNINTSAILFFAIEYVVISDGYYLDDVTVIANPICYPGSTRLRVKNLLTKQIEDVRADQVIPSIYSIINNKQEVIHILKNIVSGPEKRFVKFTKDTFGEQIPYADLLLTRGHGVLIDEKEIKARDVPEGVIIKTQPQKVYSIVCNERQYIYANGMLVATFGLKKWLKIENEVAHTELTVRDLDDGNEKD
jgi:hypothetical protein